MNATTTGEFATPIANSYWVKVGQLLAGEYPLGRGDTQSGAQLQALLDAGVTYFVDLTADDELPPYAQLLPEGVTHRRFAIADHDVPSERQYMSNIVDAIDAALAADECVYVHCRAGIGRTGTTIGCFLVRHGLSGATALETLNKLWLACERSYSWPYIPETDEQRYFIEMFAANNDSPRLSPTQALHLDRYQGAMLGLLIGDVIGTLVTRDTTLSRQLQNAGEPSSLQRLSTAQWSSDAAMALCVAESILAHGVNDAGDQMQRYLSWQRQGTHTSDGQKIEVPAAVQKALSLWQWKRNPVAGSHDPAQIDAHVLARCTPLVLQCAATPTVAIHEAAESARTTTQAPLALDACRVFAALLSAAVTGASKTEVATFTAATFTNDLRTQALKPEIRKLIERTAPTTAAGEDVISVLSAVCAALARTESFEAALFNVLQGAKRPATAGAVCGALAGALYGLQGVPIVWRETAPQASLWLNISTQLLLRAF